MKIIRNIGNDRVYDELRSSLAPPSSLDLASPVFSLFAYAELRDVLDKIDSCRIVLQGASEVDLGLVGSETDRAFRNRLNARWLAHECAAWIKKKVEIRGAPGPLPQSLLIANKPGSSVSRAITGNCSFSTDGLGNRLQATSSVSFSVPRAGRSRRSSGHGLQPLEYLSNDCRAKIQFFGAPPGACRPQTPSLIYYLTLFHIFKDRGEDLDEERIVKSATGIRNTVVWKKLYRFQRDGVIGAIDKLERFGGCIIADSVGLGKTFEALAIIKYHELRNDRVLVLCPSDCATTGRSTRPTTAAISSPPTASTTTS